MTDDNWRPHDQNDDAARRRPGKLEAEMDQFDDEEFGGPLFGDTSEHAVTDGESGPLTGSGLLRMDDDSGAMPHWTEQATGEVPRIDRPEPSPDPTDDLDVWSTFTSSTPVWNEGDPVDRPTGQFATTPADPTGEIAWEDAPAAAAAAVAGAGPDPAAVVVRDQIVLAVDGIAAGADPGHR